MFFPFFWFLTGFCFFLHSSKQNDVHSKDSDAMLLVREVKEGTTLISQVIQHLEWLKSSIIDMQSLNNLIEIVLCVIITNSVEVVVPVGNNGESETSEDGLKTIGCALFPPFFSYLNHSCTPNAAFGFLLGSDSYVIENYLERNKDAQRGSSKKTSELTKGPIVAVKAITKIYSGNEIFISYIDINQGKVKLL